MASLLRFLLLLSFSLHISSSNPSPIAILLPISKDSPTLQYTTVIRSSDLLQPINLVVDLGGPALWLDCDHHSTSLLGGDIVPSRSIHCSAANSDGLLLRTTPGDMGSACTVGARNGVVGSRAAGHLAEAAIAVGSTDGSESMETADRFLFSCGSTFLLSGLASGAVGMMGLGRTRISPPAQFAAAFGFRRRFAVCLSSDGFLAFGDSPSESVFGKEISRSLLYTPLVIPAVSDSPAGYEYFINLKSIRVNGERILPNKNRIGFAKLSTTVPYALMETSVYRAFTEAYLKAAAANNMKRAKPISPFAHCFVSTNQSVPVIDLALQSEMVKWRIQGSNSMVPVKKKSDGEEEEEGDVMCLGFIDGGYDLEAAIVIGGLELEDRVLEFDLDSSRLGFSSSLSSPKQSTPCSNLVPRLISS